MHMNRKKNRKTQKMHEYLVWVHFKRNREIIQI